MLTKRRLLAHHSVTIGEVVFFTIEMLRDGYFDNIRFSLSDWEDMGSPATVTVTIEPGDQLNP